MSTLTIEKVKNFRNEQPVRSIHINPPHKNNGFGGNGPPQGIPPTDNKSPLVAVFGAFITSIVLAIGAHATSLLDFLGGGIRKFIQIVLDFAAITLGVITTAGWVTDSYDDEQKELFQDTKFYL